MRKFLILIIPTVILTASLFLFPVISSLYVTDVEYIFPTVEDIYDYAVCGGVITAEDDKLFVTANISENDIPNVQIGQSVEISGSALGDKAYTGKVTDIAKKATKQQSGTNARTVLKCNISFDTDTSMLKSGYNVTAKIITKVTSEAVVVPFDNCLNENGNYYVYLLNGTDATRQLIEVAGETVSGFVVSEGVEPESMIVCSPNKLSGGKVKVNATAFGVGY